MLLTRGPNAFGNYTLPNGTEPTVVLDFANGVYMLDGDVVSVNDILSENLDYGEWDDSVITPDIGITADIEPIIIGDTLDIILAGSTIVTEIYINSTANAAFIFELIKWPGFETYYSTRQGYGEPWLTDNVTTYYDYDDYLPDGRMLETETHKLATTMTNGKLVRSIDGRPVRGISPAEPWTIQPDFFGMQFNDGVTVKYINIYPAQPDADLPTLSAL